MKLIVPKEDERVDVRLIGEFIPIFTRAAEISGVSLNTFINEAGRDRAVAIIEQHERIVLNNRARDMLLNALSNKPAPGKALSRAVERFAVK